MDYLFQVLQDIYTSPFNLGLVVGFMLAEWAVPAQGVDRKVHFGLDLLGFAAGLVFILSIYSPLRYLTEQMVLMDWTAVFERIQASPSWIKVVLCCISIDFTSYWIHRAMHRYPWLWVTHRWHHSVEQLYWFSGFRASFFHFLLFSVPQILLPIFILRMTLQEAAITMAVTNFFQFWKHANIRVRLGLLEWLWVTPHYHAIHHHRGEGQHSNFGFMLTLWDRLFGTRLPLKQMTRPFPMGMAGPDQKPVWRMVLGI